MIQSTAFDYVNVLDKAADASWTREALITNNLANVNTPGYKRKDLNFEGVLRQELGNPKYISLDEKVRNADLSHLNATVYLDHDNYSYRLDGSNVDIDVEEVELATEQIKYQALTTSINAEFERMRQAMGR